MRSRCCLRVWVRAYVCVCLPVYPPAVASQRPGKNTLIVARERLGKNPPVAAGQRLDSNVTAVRNTHATMKELLDASFSMCPV
jgi:hypothetical protein